MASCIERLDTVRYGLKTSVEPHWFKEQLLMGKYSKLLQKVLVGSSDSSIDFSSLCQLLVRLGFQERVKGSHHIF